MKTLSSGNCTFSVPAKNSYRMVVLGASRVGKSSIVSRFLNGRFEDQYTPTIEDFHRKVYNIRGDMYQLDILDTSGNHPFPAMRRLSILTGGCLGWARSRECGRVLSTLVCRAPACPLSKLKVTPSPCALCGSGRCCSLPGQMWSRGPESVPSDSGSITSLPGCLPDEELGPAGTGLLPSREERGSCTPPLQGGGSGARGQFAGLRSLDTPCPLPPLRAVTTGPGQWSARGQAGALPMLGAP